MGKYPKTDFWVLPEISQKMFFFSSRQIELGFFPIFYAKYFGICMILFQSFIAPSVYTTNQVESSNIAKKEENIVQIAIKTLQIPETQITCTRSATSLLIILCHCHLVGQKMAD